MKTTYRRVIEFNNLGGAYLKSLADKRKKKQGVDDDVVNITEPETKLEAAIKEIAEELEGPLKKYEKSLNAARRNHAMEDPKNMKILRDANGNYEYTKDGELALEEAIDELLDGQRELDITPIIVPIPEDFESFLIKKFKGFVFEEELSAADDFVNKTTKKVNK
jgi:hypothetical protein